MERRTTASQLSHREDSRLVEQAENFGCPAGLRAVAQAVSGGYLPPDMSDIKRAELIELFKRQATEIAEKDFSALTEASVIADMGVDSLAMLEVVGEMERELQIQIPDDQLVGIETVAQLLDLVEKRIQIG